MKLGLVLSGGGARGIAHIGVLKAINEIGISPTTISGTSAGAIVGAFYSAGFSTNEIVKVIKKNSIFHFTDVAWSKGGLLTSDSNEKMYRQYFGNKTLKQLDHRLFVSATDIQKGQTVFFDDGEIVNTIVASSTIPILFEPYKYKEYLLIDGSAACCFPVEPLQKNCNRIIGVYVNPILATKKKLSMMEVFDRGFHLSLHREFEQKATKCNLVIEPPELSEYSMFDFKKVDELVEIGYRHAMSLKSEIEKLKE